MPKHGSINLYVHGNILIVQELCESRGGRPGLSVLTSLLVSVNNLVFYAQESWSK